MSDNTQTHDTQKADGSELLPPSGSQLIEMVRILEIDHGPDGWPAIKMKHVSALADYMEHESVRADAYMEEVWRLRELLANAQAHLPLWSASGIAVRCSALLGS